MNGIRKVFQPYHQTKPCAHAQMLYNIRSPDAGIRPYSVVDTICKQVIRLELIVSVSQLQ